MSIQQSASGWVWGDLRPLSYDVIMIDPPWKFANYSSAGEKKNPSSQYRCLPIADIKAFPVGMLARADCLLWMWATNPMLPQAIEVLGAWGFKFVTAGTWVKTTKHGKLAFGTGYVLRSANEPFLIGSVGSPLTANNIRSVIMAPLRENSRKPDEAYETAEKLVPGALRRADIFSREDRPGWEAFGDEAGKFNGV
ncbi:DNA methyltransferase [Ancylobacter defluvii]|nr:DNA methyltransferase [Ancylobacter defluvii]